MINGKPWFAFFSHTGTEILHLHQNLGITPDCIVTNKPPGDRRINPDLLDLKTQFKYTSSKPSATEYDSLLSECGHECFCTLHGWMRIIPKEICNDYEMYNLHPGLITTYPELKGKDPQVRANNHELYERVGVVVHRVEPGVDEGEILIERSIKHPQQDPTDDLKVVALHAWIQFFEENILS
jgi:folate-dependent phosphoribosylglycinamide formyltransferase PurN